MPIGTPPPPLVPPEVVTIEVDFDGTLTGTGGSSRIARSSKRDCARPPKCRCSRMVHLRPTRLVKYESVAMVMASAQRLGLKKIGLIGNEQFLR